jgi:radical SAM protein with 4Fe4S-binding SPASM domain
MAISSQLTRARVDAFRLRIHLLDHTTPAKYPVRVQIETSSKCNLSCVCCSHSREGDSGRFLTVASLEDILGSLAFPLTHVTLSGNGEPLLNPDFFPSIDLLAREGLACNFFSNGTLLTPRNCEAIIERRNITMVAISCDGASKETFEQCRVGANFDKWLQSVSHFISRMYEQRPDFNVTMFTTINKNNSNEIERIIQLAAELGFKNIQLIDPIRVDELAEANELTNKEFAALDLDRLFAVARSLGVTPFSHFRRDIVPPRRVVRCLEPWQRPFIRANGNVQPCAAVFGSDRAAVMGNIKEERFLDIWRGDRFAEFRTTHVKGTNPLCRACPTY